MTVLALARERGCNWTRLAASRAPDRRTNAIACVDGWMRRFESVRALEASHVVLYSLCLHCELLGCYNAPPPPARAEASLRASY